MAWQSHEVKLLRLLRWLLYNLLAMTEKSSHATVREPNQDIKHLLSSKGFSPVTVTKSWSSSNISKDDNVKSGYSNLQKCHSSLNCLLQSLMIFF
ncbi:hypothetical protein RBEMOGI_0672 [Rickettsia bellii str. RML Mogi]|uniref:Uncharacterized protein n=1 Tax=Rickettsia bellii str. RML Mogi TaxID=1359194 RepID=A0A0F3QKW0_RICBE|nr:hypothetical protein RBEMOGI_0672 [Rickettsia bellii str. RML Mogi]